MIGGKKRWSLTAQYIKKFHKNSPSKACIADMIKREKRDFGGYYSLLRQKIQ